MRCFVLSIFVCLYSTVAFAADSQINFGSVPQVYAQASCPASDLAKALKIPRRASQACKDAFKNLKGSCNLEYADCDECQKAMDTYNDDCSPDADLNTFYDCDIDDDCGLVDIDCNSPYDPVAINRTYMMRAVKQSGWPKKGCPRNVSDRQKFQAVCIDHKCRAQTSDHQ